MKESRLPGFNADVCLEHSVKNPETGTFKNISDTNEIVPQFIRDLKLVCDPETGECHWERRSFWWWKVVGDLF
jgi:hypothetical protein